jgi:hypothetical protein
MKGVLAVAVTATGIGLSACQQVPNIGPTVKQIIAATQQACRFVPTAETVINIINAGGPIVGSSEAIANAICNSVGPPPVGATLGHPRLTATRAPARASTLVWGGKTVTIKGHFK